MPPRLDPIRVPLAASSGCFLLMNSEAAEGVRMNLIELKQQLRDLPKNDRAAITVAVHDLVEGYRHLRDSAPRRAQSYLSDTRTGLTASGETTTRSEEHLALGLFNRERRELVLRN